MDTNSGDVYSREEWIRGLVILVPLPIIWVIDWVLHRVFHWPLLAVGVVFTVLWFLLGRLALRLYDRRVRLTPDD